MAFYTRPDTFILLVCTANICRSPMAEGVMRAELEKRDLHKRIKVDSAGTHATQMGHAADARARRVCAKEGVDLDASRARQVVERDFSRYDYLLAMDTRNYDWLVNACPQPYRGRIFLLGAWPDQANPIEIPDPYFGNLEGFSHVLKLLQTSVRAFMSARLVY